MKIKDLITLWIERYGEQAARIYLTAWAKGEDSEDRKAFLKTLSNQEKSQHRRLRQAVLNQRVQWNYDSVQAQNAVVKELVLLGITAIL